MPVIGLPITLLLVYQDLPVQLGYHIGCRSLSNPRVMTPNYTCTDSQNYYYTSATATTTMPDIYTLVQSHYGEIAKRRTTSPTTQQTKEENIAKSFGYTADDLASLPEKTNLGLSCGNPVGLANVKEGETILDLGSGAGIDVFLAAKKVGEKGRAIGVDMSRVHTSTPSPSHLAPCTS